MTFVPVEPMPAASILLVREDPLRVLMVQRHARSFFASALVFPGGVVDLEDASEAWLPHLSGHDAINPTERALRIAGIRELFEETGILLGEAQQPFTRGEDFSTQARAGSATLALDALHPCAHWITPVHSAKRFDTHFYIARAPQISDAISDGSEIVTADWLTPHEVEARAAARSANIMLPTLLNMRMLARCSDFEAAIAVARQRPRVTVTPHVERRPAGDVMVIPEAAGYGITEYPVAMERAQE